MTSGSSVPTDRILRIAAAVRALRAIPEANDADLAQYAERLRGALAATDEINLHSPDRHQRFLQIAKAYDVEADDLTVAMTLMPLVES